MSFEERIRARLTTYRKALSKRAAQLRTLFGFKSTTESPPLVEPEQQEDSASAEDHSSIEESIPEPEAAQEEKPDAPPPKPRSFLDRFRKK